MIKFQSPENTDFDHFFSVLIASLEEQILGATHSAVLQVLSSREASYLGPNMVTSSFGWALVSALRTDWRDGTDSKRTVKRIFLERRGGCQNQGRRSSVVAEN